MDGCIKLFQLPSKEGRLTGKTKCLKMHLKIFFDWIFLVGLFCCSSLKYFFDDDPVESVTFLRC